MAAVWKAYIQGQKLGPVDEETIRAWVAEKKVTGRTQIWRPGMEKWLRAAEVEEFASLFEEQESPAREAEESATREAEEAATREAEESAAREAEEAATREAEEAALREAEESAAREAEEAALREAEESAAREAEEAPAREAEESAAHEAEEAPAREAETEQYSDDAATIVQQSPFLDAQGPADSTPSGDSTPPVEVHDKQEAETVQASSVSAELIEHPAPPISEGRPRHTSPTIVPPPLPLMPLLISLLGALPLITIARDLFHGAALPQALTPLPLVVGMAVGLLLLVVPPLTFSMPGLWLGLLGAFVTLGCWGVALALEVMGGEAFGQLLRRSLLEVWGSDLDAIAAGVRDWGVFLVPLLGILYYATTRKYRQRA